jgi:hypothetical protein
LFAERTENGPDAGGLCVRDLDETLITFWLRHQRKRSADGILGGEFAGFAPTSQEVQEGRVGLSEPRPCLGPSRVDDGVLADEFAREAQCVCGQFDPRRGLRGETEKIRRCST